MAYGDLAAMGHTCPDLMPDPSTAAAEWRESMTLLPEPEANGVQIGGTHYKNKSIQPWDYIAANNLGYFEGNAIKYISRWRDKGGVEDLKKAKHYIDKLIELQGGQ